jgi:alpha-beta hydrolase superfamily lysophospholipase
MRPAHVIEIVTPKKFVLNGLWFGPKKPKRAIILVHGLTASAFSMRRVVDALVDPRTAVVTFNNRGFEKVTEIKRIKGKHTEWVRSGATHEIFTECEDDIQGVVSFVKRAGVKNIYLAGHSTGCQKIVYWAYIRKGRGVRGLILFGPLSDYAVALEQDQKGALTRWVTHARKLMRMKKPHALMPNNPVLWFPTDAQRFLSLNTPESKEELFTYAQPKKNPRVFRSVSLPMLVLLAGDDEYTRRPPQELARWFMKNSHSRKSKAVVVSKVGHGFKGAERLVASTIMKFMKES